MSKAFPVDKTCFIRATDGPDYSFRLKAPPKGNFIKTPKAKGTLDGSAVEFPQTSSKGWTEPGATLYYLWLTLPDGRTGWITSDPEAPFVDGFDLSTVEGQTKRKDPERVLMTGEASPEARRLAGFTAAWAAKKAAAEVATEGEENQLTETEGESADANEAPKKKGKKK